jgi:hypothetical protein
MIRTPRGAACLSLVLLLLAGAFPARALTVVAYAFGELLREADVIVVGTARQTRSAWDATGQVIHTYVELTDLDVLKGGVPAAVFELRLPGGVVGDAAQSYPGLPQLEPGQRYILFMRGDTRTFVPFVGAYQGVYRVLRDVDGTERVLRSDQPDKLLVKGLASPAAPTLDEFVRRIRDGLANTPRDAAP